MLLHHSCSNIKVFLEGTQELLLLLWSLVSTMAEFRRSVDPFQLNLLEGLSGCMWKHGLSQGDDSLLDTWHGTLEEDEVVLNLAVPHETTHWCDGLVDNIILGSGVLLVTTLANSVNFVVHRSSVVVAVLTSTSNSPLNVGRMPCTDTSDLSETLVRLSWKLLSAPSACDTCETVTLCDSNGINHLVLLKDSVNRDWLLEETVAEFDFVSSATTIDLDLHQMRLLLLERC